MGRLSLKRKRDENGGAESQTSSESKMNNDQQSEKNVDNLRQVIKLNQKENIGKVKDPNNEDEISEDHDEKVAQKPEPEKQQQTKEKTNQNTQSNLKKEEKPVSSQNQRAVLQHIKEFDFQIKKNQEDIHNIHDKIANLTKDLDDLVSLYEIVSEQMNPFVGISKVTKKRLDMLDNITKSVQNYEHRLDQLEMVINTKKPKIEEKTTEEMSPDTKKEEMDYDQIIEEAIKKSTMEDTIEYLVEEYINNIN